MPKPDLFGPDSVLEQQFIQTLLAGLKQYRPDLDFPESYSDMQACVRGAMRMYSIAPRPLAVPLRIKCDACKGHGLWINFQEKDRIELTCGVCAGVGWIAN